MGDDPRIGAHAPLFAGSSARPGGPGLRACGPCTTPPTPVGAWLLRTAVAALLAACTSTQTRYPEQQLPAPDAGPTLPDRVDAAVPLDTGASGTDVGESPDGALCQGPATVPARWWDEAVVYEVFVRSFQDSDGDGIGDLQGLISRLDYLNDGDPNTTTDLGVDALWLMPLHPSPSYHGYDVTDYRDVNPEYGTLADFDALVAAANARGMKVVLDLVLNHTSDKHPWFVKGKRGGAEPTADWYVFRDDAPAGWGRPWEPAAKVWHALGDRFYYALFWEGMPDLNVATPAVAAELRDIGRFWADRGAAGFRLDAARYLVETGGGAGQADQPATHAFWRELRAAMGEDVLLLGEVWTTLSTSLTYAASDELQLIFDFDRQDAVRNSLRLGSAAALGSALCAALRAGSDLAAGGGEGRPLFATFVGNHDLDRLATDVRTEAGRHVALALLLTLPGVPVLYYGDELGLDNGTHGGDEAKRLPMRWDGGPGAGFTAASSAWAEDTADPSVPGVAAQLADPDSLLAFTRRLLALRRASPALRRGSTARLTVPGAPGVLLFERRSGDETVLVAANLDDAASPELLLPRAPTAPRVELGSAPLTLDASGVRLGPLGPHEVVILR